MISSKRSNFSSGKYSNKNSNNYSKLKLKDGRYLSFIERGDLNGIPILFFHGLPGSRCFRHPDNSIAVRANARVIHIDRPGFGHSDPKEGRTLLDWAEDITQLVDELQLEKFTIVGISAGGPYALACAWALENRIHRVGIISGMAPLEIPGATDGMSLLNRFGFWVARYASFLLPLVLSPMARTAEKDPQSLLDKVTPNYSKPDQKLMKRDEIREMYIEDITESYRQGYRGHAEDLRAISRPWDFDIEDIKTPINIWHGKKDQNAPSAMAKKMAERIPNTELKLIQDQGHLLLFEYWREILHQLTMEY